MARAVELSEGDSVLMVTEACACWRPRRNEPVSGSVNEPDPGLTMRDLADQAEADGRAQKPSKEDADDDL